MKHLKDHNMSYFKHLKFAFFIGFSMIVSGFCCIIHGLIPCVFQTAASDTIKYLHGLFKSRSK